MTNLWHFIEHCPWQGLIIADSLHLDLRQWLGVPSLPFVVIFNNSQEL